MTEFWKERVTNAGILLVVGVVVVVVLWYVSVGLYAVGVWPLGAVLRVLVWGFALYCLYWIARHLLGYGGTEELLRQMEARNRLMRDRRYMENVTGHRIEPELWEIALRSKSGEDAAEVWSEYAILKHKRDQGSQSSQPALM
jgi:hypothetical protein